MDLFEEKTERLIITHIVNENFKSFAGTQKLGPFHKSFTSIVGPNGSGKSNVIDSILFVFGYRSSKIRSKKLSHLIHKSENHIECKQCTVSIHFAKIDEANNDAILDSFVISRTARHDNTSDYYMNHTKRITFKEIQQLLLSYDIDVEHNRFLILQGEVEQISLMKPKAANEHDDGILEYLEDIIGTNRFIEPINTIKSSMEDLNDLRAEKYNRVKVTEKEKTALEPSRKKALEYVDKEKERNRLKSLILLNKIHKIEQDNEQLLSKKTTLDEQLSQVATNKENFESELAELNIRIDDITKELNPLSKTTDQLKRNIVQFEKDHTKQLQEEKYLNDRLEELEMEIKEAIDKKTELSNSLDKINETLDTLNGSKEKLQDELHQYEDTYNTLMIDVKKSTKDLTKEKAELDEVVLKKNEEVNKIKQQIDNLKCEMEELKSNEKNVAAQIKQRESQIKSIEQFLSENENNDKLKLIEAEKQQLEEYKQQLERVKSEEAHLIETYKEKHNSFESIKAQRNNSKFKNKIIESLLKAQSKGEIEGIFGRMGDLAYIPPEYDCAVSTAFPSLDNILVENIDVARSCVEFLRRNNLGTSTFICLDKMKTWRARVEQTKSNFSTPNNVPRLFDLIELTDHKFETAFYFIMRDTLVAKSMEEATSIAFQKKQRWRVVTLAGELVEKSGTMSGGGSRKTTGRMLTTNDKSSGVSSGGNANKHGKVKNPRRLSDLDVHKMEIEINTLKSQIADVKAEKSKLVSSVDSLTKSIPKQETNLQKIYMEIDASKNELVELNEQLTKLSVDLEQAKPNQESVDQLKNDISKKNQLLEKATTSLDKAKSKVDAVNDQIATISNKILQQVQFKINSVTRLIDEVSSEISKNNAIISNNKKQDDKLQKTLHDLNKEHSKCDQKLKAVLRKKSNNNGNSLINNEATVVYEDQLASMKQELSESEQLLETHKLNLAELQSNATRLQSEIEQQKIKLVDARNDLDKISSQCSTTTHQITAIQKELDQLNVPPEDTSNWAQYSSTVHQLHDQLAELDQYLKSNQVNLQVIDDYNNKVSIYMERVAELEEITQQRDKYRVDLDALYKERLNSFMEGFTVINSKLKEFYRLITLGGDAELEFVDSLDPFVEGVVFSVRPPNKSWKVIGNLSGGEKTLSSLALVFALHYYRPSPFYVMDEIDAALDFKNVSIIANYIKERTKNAQFIIISLRNNMFELANVLVGIYKTDNCTKSIAVDPFKMITVE